MLPETRALLVDCGERAVTMARSDASLGKDVPDLGVVGYSIRMLPAGMPQLQW